MTDLEEIRDRAKRGRTTLDDAEALLAELDAARAALGEGWFAGGATLAEAIRRKCRMLEEDAAKAAAEVKRLQGPSEEPKSEIKRYDTTTVYIGCGEYVGDVEETEDGDYVLFDDHRAIVERLRDAEGEVKVLREALRRARNRLVVGDYSEDDTNRYEEMAAFDSLIGCDTGGYNPRDIETGLASIRKAAGVER